MSNPLVCHLENMITEGLGLDIHDPSLSGTPQRIADMYTKEFFANVGKEFPKEELTDFPHTSGDYSPGIIMFDNIPFTSVCSHHFLPFSGKAWFLYIPNRDRVVGASKPTRIIQHYAARPQMQETLSRQILKRFIDIVEPQGVMLIMQAIHGCMSCRGVKSGNDSGMTTSDVRGSFADNPITRLEGLLLVYLSAMVKK